MHKLYGREGLCGPEIIIMNQTLVHIHKLLRTIYH
jgi:hypothetical protein